MADLDGSATRQELGSGLTIAAPGLVGTADLRAPALAMGRGPTAAATEDFAAALEGAGFTARHVVTIEAQQQPGARSLPGRGPGGSQVLELDVPRPAPGYGQVVLSSDEHGIMTWHLPQGSSRAAAVARGPGVDRFLVPSQVVRRPPARAGRPAARPLMWSIGKKLLSVLVFPFIDVGVRVVAGEVARRWEDKHRPSRCRTFVPGEQSVPTTVALTDADWRRLAGGRSLLFLHGVFSTSHGSFGGLPDATLAALSEAYDGRVFAFDHPTMSVEPDTNAAAFLACIPADVHLDVDIVCHSRGGLVARLLAGEIAADPHLAVHRLVFAGTPNVGTQIVDTAHIVDVLNRFTTLLNLVPPGPWSVVVTVLDVLLEIVKIVGSGFVEGLPGLVCMAPGSPLLTLLNAAGTASPAVYFAIDADFEPVHGLEVVFRSLDTGVDLVFGAEPNDVAVPSIGVGTVPGDDRFPVSPERSLRFGSDRGVWHCSYFSDAATAVALTAWLTPVP